MSPVRVGQTWEYKAPQTTVEIVVLTLRGPARGRHEWRCLVLSASSSSRNAPGSVEDFSVNNCDWWTRLA